MSQERIMYVCEVCADNSPESCGHFDRREIRVTPDGRWLCDGCYEADAAADAPHWHTLAPAPEYAPR